MKEITFSSVDRYDRLINGRIVNAPTNAEALAWWHQKIRAKRELEILSPVQALAAADRLASELERACR